MEAVGKSEQRTTTFTYDNEGQRLTQTVKGLTPVAGFTPDPTDTAYQDATTTWTYDANGNVASVTDPEGNTTTFTYDTMGNGLTRTDALNHTTSTTYNAKGWLMSVTNPLNHSTSFTYDKLGRRLSTTDAQNHTTTTTYNANGWPITITDPLGKVTTLTYDAAGRMIKTTDAENVSTQYGYDGNGRLNIQTDGAGNVTQFQYGTANGLQGQLVATVYPTYTEQYKLDPRGRRTMTIRVLPEQNGQPDQSEFTQTGYDANGNVTANVDALGHTTFTTVDALNRVDKVTEPGGGITQYTYGSRDQLLKLTDANGNTHTFAYDLAGRLTKETRPLGGMIQYTYDAVGNLLTRTNPKGDQRTYTYDAANRRTQETQTPVNAQSPSQTITYTYSATHQLIGYTQTGDTESSASYSYDAKGQKTQEEVTYGSGQNAFTTIFVQKYTDTGQLKTLTYPDGKTQTYTYTQSRLTGITTPDASAIQYNQYQWNQPTQILLPKVVKTLTYDPLQRPKTIQSQQLGNGTISAPNGTILMNVTYSYDKDGDITQRQTPDGNYSYAYDQLHHLTSATPPTTLQQSQANPNGLPVENYSYDFVHNRTTSQHQPGTWNYNAENHLTQWGLPPNYHALTYDNNGHTSEDKTLNDPNDPTSATHTRTYTYNAAERLTEITTNGITTATYQYDPMGRRIKKVANNQTIWTLYSDQGLIAEYDQTHTLKRTYGWKPNQPWGTDPLWLADITIDTANNNATLWTMHYFHNDHLGTPQRLTDKDGNVTW